MAFLGIQDYFRFVVDFLVFYSIYFMLSTSMNLDYGFAGIPNLGKVLFFAIGAFVTGSLSLRIVAQIAGIQIEDFVIQNIYLSNLATSWLSSHYLAAITILLFIIFLSALIGGIFGILASLPAIKLKETYLAISLLVIGEIIRYIGSYYSPLIGGTVGTHVPDFFSWISSYRVRDLIVLTFFLTLAIASWFFVHKLVSSPYGRILKAHRENEDVFKSLGKDPIRMKMQVMFVSSSIAGLAGSLYAIYSGQVNASDFVPDVTFVLSLIVVIGGIANSKGPIVGSLIYVAIDRIIRQAKYYVPVPFDVNYLSLLLMGIILLIIFFVSPKGILEEKPILQPETLKINDKKPSVSEG